MPPTPLNRSPLPEPGQLVHVRSRRWLVDYVEPRGKGHSALVRMACADDDAQGQILEVFWDIALDAHILAEEGWARLGDRGFDKPRLFSAFLHAMRWNCVTSTDPRLVQSPFRAGIKLDAYQIEPLRKALQLPLVNLFIADDTGLGKTIEAGLIARELLLRKKVNTIVVGAPASVLDQWKAELEQRFGLLFVVLNREYLARMRRSHGFSINPWKTHNQFLISHNLLADPNYGRPLRQWLGDRRHGSLLILDEAHHAAPSSGGSYGIESKFTRAIRDISGRFEHRLFLSATPHNGHSTSFSTLLEILDPHRFTRGVEVRKQSLREVMVRRLKEDIRAAQGGFPRRTVEAIEIAGLPADAPELQLSELLDEYRAEREKRFKDSTRRAQATAALVTIGLQQRLLSSIEAFARSLEVHMKTVRRQREKALGPDDVFIGSSPDRHSWLGRVPDADDPSARESDDDLQKEEDRQFEAATAESEAEAREAADAAAQWDREERLLRRMKAIADRSRWQRDPKVRWLLRWIRQHMCPLGDAGTEPARWKDRRILIFTENRQGTKMYLRETLKQAIEGTELCYERIAVIDGLSSRKMRREIQRRFNAPPAEDPLRILLATDAAREGLNFQAHCADLFHYDLPWNPGRIEQRNGRIDRKLQPAEVVRCRYFVLPQRKEDRVLNVLVRKTETIRKELGSLSAVLEESIERKLLRHGIRHQEAAKLAGEIDRKDIASARKALARAELDAARDRKADLQSQIERCRRILQRSRQHVDLDSEQLREVLSSSLEMQGAAPLKRGEGPDGEEVWILPRLEQRAFTDPSWISTLDSLRVPRKRGEKIKRWRKEAAIRPVVFEDPGVLSDATVHLHLEQRMAQRLLARFRVQGFVHHDLSRACLAQTADSLPRVVLLGRLLLYGRQAERLHEEVMAVTARWIEPERRRQPLAAFGRAAEDKTLGLLDRALGGSAARMPGEAVQRKLLASAERDTEELGTQLHKRAREAAAVAEQKLAERGASEERKLARTLKDQRKRVAIELEKQEGRGAQLKLEFSPEEQKQIAANVRAWKRRIKAFDRDIETEPARVRDLYKVRSLRIEPVGLVYLWPETN